MLLENNHLSVNFEELPFPVSYTYKKTGQTLAGVSADSILKIDGKAYSLSDFEVSKEQNAFRLSVDGYSLRFEYELQEDHLLYRVSPGAGSKHIEYIDLSGMPLLKFGDDYRYAKDTYTPKPWHSPLGRGLFNYAFEEGKIIETWPHDTDPCVHACGFKDGMCAFVRTDYAVMPLTTKFVPHEKYQQRSGSMSLGLNKLYFDLVDKKFESWEFSIHLIGDLNGDGKADECDYQLALKKWLPEPSPIYKNTVWYKVLCAVNGYTHATFKQTLEIVKFVHHITSGAKQIVYLAGWQYTGHDSGYPSFDKINSEVGTREELLELISVAKEKYNCTISIHINVDDSYPANPGWREDLICQDVTGKPMTWEVFLQKQAYHICHTKDVRSGDIFRRIDDLLAVFPVKESIHIDAFRNTNSSWEENEFIGPDKELYCGQLPIIEYFRKHGIDVTTESMNGMEIELSGVFSGLYHMFIIFPILYQNKLYGGGSRNDPMRVATGASINADFTYNMLGDKKQILRPVVMQNMMYRFMLQRNMVEYRTGGFGWRAYARYDDGTETYADNGYELLEMKTPDGTLIADANSRFIPLDGYIYAYQTVSGLFRRKLPKEFRGVPVKCSILTECSDWLEFGIDGDYLQMILPADTLIRFEKA